MSPLMNTAIIVFIFIALIAVVAYYAKQLQKTPDDFEAESIYSIDALTNAVASEFADMLKANLKEQNLTKKEAESKKRKKHELRKSLKTAAFGDESAKNFIKTYIKEILRSRKYGIDESNIDKVIPFSTIQRLELKDKAQIMFHIYRKNYGTRGFLQYLDQYSLLSSKNITDSDEESGELRYEVTKARFEETFEDIYANNPLTFDDKLEIVTQIIFSKYKGLSVVDPLLGFAMDEIDCGVSGIPKGVFDLKPHLIPKNCEYSYESIWVMVHGINLKLSFLSFGSQEELIRVCQNIYKYSAPYALSRNKGYVVGTMKGGERISVGRPPALGSWCFFLRKFDSIENTDPTYLLEGRDKDNPVKNVIIPIIVTKWIMRARRSMVITGGMGSGKTTWLKSIIRFLPSSKNIGVFEISPELMLQLIYPLRNVVNYAVTESISMEDLYDFSKKTNRAVSILAEVASAVMSVIFMHSASVGSEQALGTHHAKTTEDFVLATRDNLTNAGGYSSEAVAEETVVKCIPFDTHWEKDKDLRYIERITEIIPIRDRRYPADKNAGQFSEEDTLEYYKRSTDRRAFTTRNIVEFRNGKYVLANMFTDEMMLEIRSHLSADEEALFLSDMELLKKLSDESEEQ